MKRFYIALLLFSAVSASLLYGSFKIREECENMIILADEIINDPDISDKNLAEIEKRLKKDRVLFSLAAGKEKGSEILKSTEKIKRLSKSSDEEIKSLLYSFKYDLTAIKESEDMSILNFL